MYFRLCIFLFWTIGIQFVIHILVGLVKVKHCLVLLHSWTFVELDISIEKTCDAQTRHSCIAIISDNFI